MNKDECITNVFTFICELLSKKYRRLIGILRQRCAVYA